MDMNQIQTIIILRNDSTANWLTNASKVLERGEVGIEFLANGNAKMKIGDGTSTWSALPYFGGDESHVFQADLGVDETHDAAIARVVGATVLTVGDIAIVTEQIAGDKESKTAYSYNGTAWAAMDGNYDAKNIYFSENLLLTEQMGLYKPDASGSVMVPTFDNKMSMLDLINGAYSKENDPTKTDPSVAVSLSKAGSYEVGTVVTGIAYTATFEDGKYTYGPEPTGAAVSAWSVTDTAGNTYTDATANIADVTVEDGTNFSVTATATHTAGSVPTTNKGNPVTNTDLQIAAGTKSKTSSAITGYRSFFYGVLDTTSAEAPLTSDIIRGLTNGGAYNAAKTFTLNGSETAKRIVVAIPSNSTRGGLSEVILTSAMNTPVTDAYTKTTAAVAVEGVNGATAIDYTTYVYEPATIDAGEVHQISLK